MSAPERPTLRTLARRVSRLRCPVCGRGRLFHRGFRRARDCGGCGWTFERCEGHWVGGTEVQLFLSYGLSVAIAIPIIVLFGAGPWVAGSVIAGHVALSAFVCRYSRATFLAIDYYLDPEPPPGPDDGDDDRERAAPRTPRPPGRARRRAAPLPRAGDRRPAASEIAD